jgi:hypothetical protein
MKVEKMAQVFAATPFRPQPEIAIQFGWNFSAERKVAASMRAPEQPRNNRHAECNTVF